MSQSTSGGSFPLLLRAFLRPCFYLPRLYLEENRLSSFTLKSKNSRKAIDSYAWRRKGSLSTRTCLFAKILPTRLIEALLRITRSTSQVPRTSVRSEEHTSELQSRLHLLF